MPQTPVTPETHPELDSSRRETYVHELGRIRNSTLPMSEWMDRLNANVRMYYNSTTVGWTQIFGNARHRQRYEHRPYLPFYGTVDLLQLLRDEVPDYKP